MKKAKPSTTGKAAALDQTVAAAMARALPVRLDPLVEALDKAVVRQGVRDGRGDGKPAQPGL